MNNEKLTPDLNTCMVANHYECADVPNTKLKWTEQFRLEIVHIHFKLLRNKRTIIIFYARVFLWHLTCEM